MRRYMPPALLLMATLPLLAQQQEPEEGALPPPVTHQEAANRLVDFLAQVELCLASCTDAESVQAALPRLEELARQAQSFKTAQERLPEPTTQDYMAAQSLLKDFNTIWQAIRDHVERLKRDGLLTPELSRILVISPED